jgi:hypothetical protein
MDRYFLRMRRLFAFFLPNLLFTGFCFISTLPALHAEEKSLAASLIGPEKPKEGVIFDKPTYPWKKEIVTTTFWIGQGSSGYNSTTNYKSAWDTAWTENFGGLDDPIKRVGLLPSKIAATLNPFYIALPFNDLKYPALAKKYVPWYKEPPRGLKTKSQCKGRWLEIRTKEGKSCFAQWEDVGPFRYDHANYVFGNDRPTTYSKAGLDVSPAVRDYLGLTGLDVTDWRFVENADVPDGPWMKYYEQAIIYSALKRQEAELRKADSLPTSAPTVLAAQIDEKS